jgi:pyruvate carboxylase
MFSTLLVANRGEIAVRAFRAAYELGIRTVAVFPWEDRNAVHRTKADEAYLIGERGHPVRAYLDIDEIVRVAREAGADAVYPGYGFLSENPRLASACEAAGITFVGPPPRVLSMAGNKVRAVEAARAAGVPVLRSSSPSADVDELVAAAEEIGFPVFAKAVAGGGGRGMRRVEDRAALRESLETAMREAEGAFGDPTLFLEQAVLRPRHIEVQVLADAGGETVHLFERDCSVQRRHQKVVEIAPAPALDPAVREALCRDAVAFARQVGYVNAGTVEFLLDTAGANAGRHVFIEMNPRIQVEHTVTEEVTDVDLVQAQIRIAAGETLADLGLTQDRIQVHGAALQCRITTEDPANGFRPDTGIITTYRSPGGAGIRLDGGTAHAGASISPHFDSMLVKLVARGADFPSAVRRASRALAEFRIRGVSTNVPFLQAVLAEPDFVAGGVPTSFIDERPHLLQRPQGGDRGSRLLSWLADVTVNRPHGEARVTVSPREKLPQAAADAPPAGWREVLRAQGPGGFARTLRDAVPVAVTDTTFRDAHQSLLATRVRTRDLLAAAPAVAGATPQLLSVECWGGATYDVALRFLGEDPWERLAALREAMPTLCLQMLLRGRNTVGYTPYPTAVTDAFVEEAAATGIDIFRIFDALNDVDQMRPAVDAVRATGSAVAEVALCYTADLTDPSEKLYTLDYYLRLAEQIVDAGAHILAIKDMAGLAKPFAARALVKALRDEVDVPIHFHTHDTSGINASSILKSSEAGVDAADAAVSSMSGTTSQPNLDSIVAALANTERDTGLDVGALQTYADYWEAVRTYYLPFDNAPKAGTAEVYLHEMPGGQYTNLKEQAAAMGLGERWHEVAQTYADVNMAFGDIVKVTPSSKVVGDMALYLVSRNMTVNEFRELGPDHNLTLPNSVVDMFQGSLGEPEGGWPADVTAVILKGGQPQPGRPGEHLAPVDLEATLAELQEKYGPDLGSTDLMSHLMYPDVFAKFMQAQQAYGTLAVLPTPQFLYGMEKNDEVTVELEPGKTLIVKFLTLGEPQADGTRTIYFELNGQPREVVVQDKNQEATAAARAKADPNQPGHVGAPIPGAVTSLVVHAGQAVKTGDKLLVMEAMKMQTTVYAPVAGTVKEIVAQPGQTVEAKDLLLVIE